MFGTKAIWGPKTFEFLRPVEFSRIENVDICVFICSCKQTLVYFFFYLFFEKFLLRIPSLSLNIRIEETILITTLHKTSDNRFLV